MTAAAATVPRILSRCPSAVEIDELAGEFFDLQTKAAEAYKQAATVDEPLEALKEELVMLVEAFGGAHAGHSKLLAGVGYELLATFGTGRNLDTAAVLKFRGQLMCDRTGKKGREPLFPMLFETCESFRLRPAASEIIRAGALSPRLLGLYANCEVLKALNPRLTVRQR